MADRQTIPGRHAVPVKDIDMKSHVKLFYFIDDIVAVIQHDTESDIVKTMCSVLRSLNRSTVPTLQPSTT